MNTVLIVEDSRTIGEVLKAQIEKALSAPVKLVASYGEAKTYLETEADNVFVGLLDLNLPDAATGEIVDLVSAKDIPVIVFTADMNNDTQDFIWSKNVVDYVFKEGQQNIDYLIDVIKRLEKNREVKVLVVDDSPTARAILKRLLEIHRFHVLEASDGEEALKLLEEYPETLLMITDFLMPNMDGYALIRHIRATRDKRSLAIIGVSTEGNRRMSARFIKHGANDFLRKPFSTDEFYCRVNQNIEMIEYVRTIQEASTNDFLTQLRNRRYFFDKAPTYFEAAEKDGSGLSIAMIDIDHFKNFNDTHGHATGDHVLKHVSDILKNSFSEESIVARFGGEEFCVLSRCASVEEASEEFEALRVLIESSKIQVGDEVLNITVSIGVCAELLESLESMIADSDEKLYLAKEGGRNRTVLTQ